MSHWPSNFALRCVAAAEALKARGESPTGWAIHAELVRTGVTIKVHGSAWSRLITGLRADGLIPMVTS